MAADASAQAHHGDHDPHLAHHFESPTQQFESVRLAMWIFLATEVLFFGGLFCAYAVYRANHPEIFLYAHQFLSKTLGAVNTVILICSSFTMAWAVRAAQLRQRAVLQLMLVLTLLCAFGFLGIKYVEYREKWSHGLLWAGRYDPHVTEQHAGGHGNHAADDVPAAAAAPAPDAADEGPATAMGPSGLAEAAAGVDDHQIAAEPANARIFFSIYFLMTGLHGIHVLGGIAIMLWLLWRSFRGAFTDGYFTPVDMTGLYWHLVDLIWIYLFLLLYLIH